MAFCTVGCCEPFCNVNNENDITFRNEQFTEEDACLAQEMNSLSVQERETVYDDIHGCAGIAEETPTMIAKCIEELRSAVDQLPPQSRKAYNRAVFLRPSVETDDKFQLMFLRAHRFDPKKAAYHMCRSFEHKLKLFGEEKLVKKITLDDLGEVEMIHMYSGAMQVLPSKDSSGRGLFLVTVPNIRLDEDWYALQRYTWYQIYSAGEGNDDLQKNGCVQIITAFDQGISHLHRIGEYLKFTAEFAGDWPTRLCGTHYCYDQVSFHRAWRTMLALRGKDFRLRNRTHFGSKIEVQYALLTFGIQLKDCFDANKGILSKQSIDMYLQSRRWIEAELQQQENSSINAGTVLYPTTKDVLMGRGRPYVSWPGNIRLPHLVVPFLDQYRHMGDTYNGKARIALEVVNEVRREGGQFLQRCEGYWEVVDENKAKEKVSQIFRAEIRNRQGVEAEKSNAVLPMVLNDGRPVFRTIDAGFPAVLSNTTLAPPMLDPQMFGNLDGRLDDVPFSKRPRLYMATQI